MKQTILCFALLIAGANGKIYAQENTIPEKRWSNRSKAEKEFSVNPDFVNIRDFVQLDNNAKMIVELSKVSDYTKLHRLGPILSNLTRDIAFYKDSLQDAGSVRIDYSVTDNSDMVRMRFLKHKADGDIYVRNKADIAHLKLDADTIRIVMNIKEPVTENDKGRMARRKNLEQISYYAVSVTFLLNRFTDINTILADTAALAHMLDTLQATKSKSTINSPDKFPSSTIYKPVVNYFRLYNGIKMTDASASPADVIQRSDKLTFNMNLGAGLVRNTITPTAEMGISIYSLSRAFYTSSYQKYEYNTYASLSISPYFFFDKTSSGDHIVNDNWFVNCSIGGATQFLGLTTPLLTGGVGWLAVRKGDVFKGTTMKVFMDFKLRNGISISPELISTNDFKQIFPGITLKLL